MGNRLVVVDVETTGLWRSDRVVEIACVVLDQDAGVVDEWATLVNPMRDVGSEARSIHGLSAADLSDSPTFPEIAGTIAAQLSGSVVAGHNLAFDRRMLELEYARLGVLWPPLPAMCTMSWAAIAGVRSRALSSCCDEVGVDLTQAHSALADARATAALFLALVERSAAMLTELSELESRDVEFLSDGLGVSMHTRQRPQLQARRSTSFVSELIDRLPAHPELSRSQNCYLAVLDHALSDSILTDLERIELAAITQDLGVDPAEAEEAHRIYVDDLIDAALRDGQITVDEREHLDAIAGTLGLDQRVAERSDTGTVREAAVVEPGMVVCFTGDWNGVVGREPWSRELAHRIAERAGLVAIGNVTKKCQLVVAGDATSMSGKAQKARQYGIPVVSVEQFLAALRSGCDSD
jgi:DNA polymerase-3 subunit epsilon